MRWPVGESLRDTSTMVSCTVIVRTWWSMCRGRRATSSPQRRPVSIAVITIGVNRGGIWVRSVAYSSGVRVRVVGVTTLGRSVASQGLKAMSRSVTARAKTECSNTWYLTIERADRPLRDLPWSWRGLPAWLTHSCTVLGTPDSHPGHVDHLGLCVGTMWADMPERARTSANPPGGERGIDVLERMHLCYSGGVAPQGGLDS